MKTTRIRNAVLATALALGLASTVAGSAGAVGVGETCGGIGGIRCDRGLWCDLEAGKCGVKDAEGKCIKIPAKCPKDISWVCGCNKRNYTNDCTRQRAKVQKDHDGRCTK
jgi:hypothetical protein